MEREEVFAVIPLRWFGTVFEIIKAGEVNSGDAAAAGDLVLRLAIMAIGGVESRPNFLTWAIKKFLLATRTLPEDLIGIADTS